MSINAKHRTKILGCPIDPLTLSETVGVIDKAIQGNMQLQHAFVDAGKLSILQTDPDLRKHIMGADIVNADGQSLVWFSNLDNQPLPEKVADIDLMMNLVELAHQREYRIYFLGGTEATLDRVVETVSKKYSPGVIAGYRNGHFSGNEDTETAHEIADSNTHMLFVGLSSPADDEFLYKHKEILMNINFKTGVGGSFDLVAGNIRRPPVWMRKMCMEWLSRFLQEPQKAWKGEVYDSFHCLILLLKDKMKLRR